MAVYPLVRYRFDLRVEKYVVKDDDVKSKPEGKEKKIEWRLAEELNFKTLTVKDALKKLIGYLD